MVTMVDLVKWIRSLNGADLNVWLVYFLFIMISDENTRKDIVCGIGNSHFHKT